VLAVSAMRTGWMSAAALTPRSVATARSASSSGSLRHSAIVPQRAASSPSNASSLAVCRYLRLAASS